MQPQFSNPNKEVVSGINIGIRADFALTAAGFVSEPGECEKFAREVIQSLYPNLFDAFWKGSAAETLQAFKSNGVYFLKPTAPMQEGDMLYKGVLTSGPAGHVGILLHGGLVAENSSYHWLPNAPHPDARGKRNLAQFGAFEGIVRLSIYSKGRQGT